MTGLAQRTRRPYLKSIWEIRKGPVVKMTSAPDLDFPFARVCEGEIVCRLSREVQSFCHVTKRFLRLIQGHPFLQFRPNFHRCHLNRTLQGLLGLLNLVCVRLRRR